MRRGAEPGGSAPRVLRGFLQRCAVSCHVARCLAVLRRILQRCAVSCRVASQGVFRVEWRGLIPPRDETQATPAHVIPRVKPTPPLHAHNTTIQANFGMQGRCRFHLLEPQGTQGRCRFRTFPRVPSYGGMPADFRRSRRHASACRSALLGRGTTVAPLTCSRQP